MNKLFLQPQKIPRVRVTRGIFGWKSIFFVVLLVEKKINPIFLTQKAPPQYISGFLGFFSKNRQNIFIT
jgi:hypothetical protein